MSRGKDEIKSEMFLSLSASQTRKFLSARRCSGRGLVKNTILCPPETTSGFRPRATGKKKNTRDRKIPVQNWNRAFKGNARDSRRLILRPGERWIRAFFDKFEK